MYIYIYVNLHITTVNPSWSITLVGCLGVANPIVRLPICRTTQRTILPRILWKMTAGEWQGDGKILCKKIGICNNKKQKQIASTHLSNEEQPGCLGCIGGCATVCYRVYSTVSHYRNPYSTASILECCRGSFRSSCVFVRFFVSE